MLSRDAFANPPSRFRPIPFWFWNSKMRIEEIESQIRDFHEKGLGGFFIHARFGLETEYLSREWMECVKHAVKVASELDMEVWLYDENGFPSGIGDLKVSRVPEYRSRFIDLTEADAASEAEIELHLPPGDVLMAYAYPRSEPGGERIDLASSISGGVLKWRAPRGEWSMAIYSKRVLEDPNDVVFGVDYLNPEAMRYFLDLTLEPYTRAVGERFGRTIKGIFTDEPTLLPWHHDINWYGQREHTRVVVWDDRIEPRMRSRTGLDAGAFLPHLFFEIDEHTPEVRRAFWRTVADLYVEAFFKPYSERCERLNLKLTGHVLFEEGLYINTDFQADITELLSTMHIPGADHLGEVTETPYGGFSNVPRHLTNLQGQKLVASIAHHAGREAVISETYGCAGWGLSFEKMKWIADWQYSLGINMLCPHALFYSIEGFRKSDAPPSENHMAAWKHYRCFADYIGRLSYALREGSHAANVALFYPLREFWGRHAIGRIGEEDRVLSDSFDLCASSLPRLHADYDILSEQALASAQVAQGKLRVRDEEYSVLIAPPFSIEGRAMEVVREFLETGGTWILPPTTRGEPEREQIDREIALMRGSVSGDLADRWAREVEEQWPKRPRHVALGGGDGEPTVIATLAGTTDPEGVMRALEGALDEVSARDITLHSIEGEPLPDVRYVHRKLDDGHVYFITNTSGQAVHASITLTTPGAVEEWNPETGEVRPAAVYEADDARVRLERGFAPYGSTLYVVHAGRHAVPAARIEARREEVMVLPDEWLFAIEQPNALILGEWSLKTRVHSSGEEYIYATSFACRHLPPRLLLMLDDIEYRASLMGGMDLTIEVNGTRWRRPEFGWYLDRGFKTLDISSAVLLGENSLTVVINHSAWSGQPHLISAPAALLGDFAVDPATRDILAPTGVVTGGSWTEAGYPFFSGTGVYTQRFHAPAPREGARSILAIDDVRDSVEIVLNGRSVDVRLWQPWEADVTQALKEGENVLSLKVTNSMLNFLEAHPTPSGLMGRVRIEAED